MSFFKNLFSKKNNDTEAPQTAKVQETKEPLPEMFQGMSLDIFTEDGAELLTGQESQYYGTNLNIESLPGWLDFET